MRHTGALEQKPCREGSSPPPLLQSGIKMVSKSLLAAHIRGLEANLMKLRAQQDKMTGPEYCPPNACCPSCFWGDQLRHVEEAIERREQYLKVLRCRQQGLRPQKTRMVMYLVPGGCMACGGTGRTTLFSVGRCTCGEPHCPGRGRCHSCGGTGRSKKVKAVVTRPWPKEIS